MSEKSGTAVAHNQTERTAASIKFRHSRYNSRRQTSKPKTTSWKTPAIINIMADLAASLEEVSTFLAELYSEARHTRGGDGAPGLVDGLGRVVASLGTAFFSDSSVIGEDGPNHTRHAVGGAQVSRHVHLALTTLLLVLHSIQQITAMSCCLHPSTACLTLSRTRVSLPSFPTLPLLMPAAASTTLLATTSTGGAVVSSTMPMTFVKCACKSASPVLSLLPHSLLCV